ncbi:MAG TPA: hypothetical protein VM054_09545 [bacterium]|nr:hypothetical protein [bacterium]
MKTALRILLILGLLMVASCKIGRRPMGVAFVLRDGSPKADTSRAFYMPVLGDEVQPTGLRFGDPVELPFTGPVDQLVFTPDGRELWAWAGADVGEPALWSLAFSGDRFGEPERRFDLASYPAGLSSAAAPRADGVVFDALEPVTGRWQIFILDDGGLRQLTPGEADYQSPTLSPDGSVVVFSSNRDGAGGAKMDWGLWGCEIATESLFAVYDTPSDEGSPWFAPDGALYFDSFEYVGEVPVGSIRRLDDPAESKGSPTAERVAGIEGLVLFPRPSPDGEWLLITVYDDPRWMSRIVNLETLESRPLAGEDAEITYACWR